MRFKYSNHFQARLIEQGISFQQVQDAMRYPDSIEEVYRGRTKVTKLINGKPIAVIYCKDISKGKKNTYALITAYDIRQYKDQNWKRRNR